MDFLQTAMPYIMEILAYVVIVALGVVGSWIGLKLGKRTELKNINNAMP